MLKKLILFFIVAFPSLLMAQDDMPSSVDEVIIWKFNVVSYECDVATLEVTVEQRDGWHIYAQKQPAGAVSLPTSFEFVPNKNYELIGKTQEFGTEEHVTEGIPERYFPGKKATFKQRIKIKSEKDFKIQVKYSFMACKTACFPPEDRDTEFIVKGVDPKQLPCETEPVKDTTSTNGAVSWMSKLAGTCEGFYYEDEFLPIRVKANTPVKKNFNTYEISVDVSIDSIFNMYDFTNQETYKSLFQLHANDNVTLSGEPRFSLKSTDNVFSKPDSADFILTYYQDITLKDTAIVDTVFAFMDIYLQGCSANFKNTAPVELAFDIANPVYQDRDQDESSLWIIFIVSFASGLIALLTPCVFPMIPMTVTFFTKQSKTKSEGIRKAILYALFIIIIYVFLGVVISAIFGAGSLNAMATNAWVNLCFAILFMVFAISFLGAFEITLPASWVNKADRQADKGGLIGIFFMAFTLALVSFSCTGPIVGSVLVKSAETGEVIAPVISMLGFSLALALPFGLFAAFPGWLNSLPQSGGWLNVVKVTLGLAEIAFAIKFLLQADQGFETFIISREIFIALWIAVFLVMGMYLLGFIQFPHDSKVEKLAVGRGLLGMTAFAFVVYLLPGMWGAPVNIIAGLTPSMEYAESPYGVNMLAPKKDDALPESAHYHGHGIWVIKDYDEALAYAKAVDKPLLIDFTGIQCVNCRKMENFVWANEEIAPIMAEKFVIASLFVDDKASLPKEKWGVDAQGNAIKEVGKKWLNFESTKYGEATQPLYVVVDHNEDNISGKANYQSHSNPADFKQWLDKALLQYDLSKNPNILQPEFEIVE